MTDTRASHLGELLQFSRPIADVAKDLSVFGWDSDEDLITLEPAHALSVLIRFLANELSAIEIEDWANAIECREDIGFDQESAVAAALFELANPLITRPLTRQSATDLVAKLHGAATEQFVQAEPASGHRLGAFPLR